MHVRSQEFSMRVDNNDSAPARSRAAILSLHNSANNATIRTRSSSSEGDSQQQPLTRAAHTVRARVNSKRGCCVFVCARDGRRRRRSPNSCRWHARAGKATCGAVNQIKVALCTLSPSRQKALAREAREWKIKAAARNRGTWRRTRGEQRTTLRRIKDAKVVYTVHFPSSPCRYLQLEL